MPSNIEIKAKINNLKKLQILAEKISDTSCEIQYQKDIFYQSKKGRLKLRIINSEIGNLISYFRPDTKKAKQSNYKIFKTENPNSLQGILSESLEEIVTVKKKRLIYLVGQTRIHLDEVENLGNFMEIEVVLKPNQDSQEGHKIAKDLMEKLEIKSEDLISCAYADLILKKK
ncbi:MAG: class IV adenylate cyclase [Calditrichaeota bacterium]|nr:MAG: class IV adenylate cyclase [Calditrichota bacterium]